MQFIIWKRHRIIGGKFRCGWKCCHQSEKSKTFCKTLNPLFQFFHNSFFWFSPSIFIIAYQVGTGALKHTNRIIYSSVLQCLSKKFRSFMVVDRPLSHLYFKRWLFTLVIISEWFCRLTYFCGFIQNASEISIPNILRIFMNWIYKFYITVIERN